MMSPPPTRPFLQVSALLAGIFFSKEDLRYVRFVLKLLKNQCTVS